MSATRAKDTLPAWLRQNAVARVEEHSASAVCSMGVERHELHLDGERNLPYHRVVRVRWQPPGRAIPLRLIEVFRTYDYRSITRGDSDFALFPKRMAMTLEERLEERMR